MGWKRGGRERLGFFREERALGPGGIKGEDGLSRNLPVDLDREGVVDENGLEAVGEVEGRGSGSRGGDSGDEEIRDREIRQHLLTQRHCSGGWRLGAWAGPGRRPSSLHQQAEGGVVALVDGNAEEEGGQRLLARDRRMESERQEISGRRPEWRSGRRRRGSPSGRRQSGRGAPTKDGCCIRGHRQQWPGGGVARGCGGGAEEIMGGRRSWVGGFERVSRKEITGGRLRATEWMIGDE